MITAKKARELCEMKQTERLKGIDELYSDLFKKIDDKIKEMSASGKRALKIEIPDDEIDNLDYSIIPLYLEGLGYCVEILPGYIGHLAMLISW